MRYKCCHCENFLVPQGPIQAFVSIESGGLASLAQINVELDDDFKINNLGEIEQLSTQRESSKSIEILFQTSVAGTLGKIEIKKYTLSTFKAVIEIQCDNCKHLCRFSI